MLDLLVTNGRVVTPHGVGAWDVAVQGERIVAVTPPGTFWPVTTILRGKVIVERGLLHGALADGRLVPRKIDPVMLRRPGC